MINHNRSYYSNRISRTQWITPSFTEALGYDGLDKLDVVNGLVSGDRKNPNPISFKKIIGRGTTFLETTSGVKWGAGISTSTTGNLYGGGDSTTPTLPRDYGRTSDNAIAKVYDKIKGNSNLVVDLAESAATIRMLRSTVNLKQLLGGFFTKITRVSKRGRANQAQMSLDYVTGKWLEYRYGWMPLLNSIYDAMDQMSHRVINLNPVVTGQSGYETQNETLVGAGSYVSPRTWEKFELSCRTQYGIQFELPPGLQIYDWTSLNPLGIAWELLPLSFVGDWVVNVSQQLELLENYWIYNSRFRKGYRTDTCREKAVSSTFGYTALPRQYWSNGTPIDNEQYVKSISRGWTRTISQKDRTVLTSLPMPTGLRLNVKVGSARQLDSAALIHQLLVKKLRKFSTLI